MSKRQLIVYNTNNPAEHFTCISVEDSEGTAPFISRDEFAIIEATCLDGPYLCFFRDDPEKFYIMRHFHPSDENDPVACELWITMLHNDEMQQNITSEILRRICEAELKTTADKKRG